MPKILIIEPCAIRLDPDANAQHHDQGEIAEVGKQDAEFLTRHGRALYTNKADDPSKGNLLTASAEMLKEAAKLAKARATPPAPPPAGGQGEGGDA